MKKIKKIIILLATVTMLTVWFAFGVSAEGFTESYYTYTVENGEATITAVDNSINGDVVIPDTLGGYPVVSIGDRAFEECVAITNISLPDSLVKIGYGAFAYCFNINEINFGKNLKTISEMCFLSCFNLTKITLPDSLEIIEKYAFHTCYSLNKISISENLKEIGCDAFTNCVTLEKIYLYANDVAIGEQGLGYNNYIVDTNKISKSNFAEKVRQAYSLCLKDMSDDTVLTEFEKKVSELNNYYSYEDKAQVNTDTTIYGKVGSTAETYAKENGINFEVIKEDTTVTVTDEKTNVIAEYDSSVFGSDAELVITPNGKNANIIFNGKFGKFISYDISFEIDGEKVQPNGKVTIKIPLPDGYNANATKVFYVDDNGHKTKLDSTYSDGYIIFATDHFSEYVLVDESSKIEEPSTEPDTPTDESCDHLCHKSGFMGFIWKIIRFFIKLFKTNAVCYCGAAHY